MKFYFALLFLFFLAGSGKAQFYEYGQDPSSLKWKRLDTPHFKIVFPADFSTNAQRLANLLEGNYTANSAQLDHEPKKIPLVIHNQGVYSNAFVTWAPKRMEFYTFPDPDLYPIDWLYELSLHEFRHVVQIDKLNQGFTRFLSLMLGQQGNGLIAGLTPLWFIEGDAVSAETSLSLTGRGRLPSFEMELKTQLLSREKPYTLSKAYLGSYKDFVPDHYRLGYQMVSYARTIYGQDFWSNGLDYMGRRPFLVSPLYFYSKKVTGGGQRYLYKNTMAYLKNHWSETGKARQTDSISAFNQRKTKKYTSYTHPVFLDDATVVAIKTGINIIPRFVSISEDKKEKTLFVPGTMVSGRFSIYDRKIIWDEYTQDPRWKNRSYSIIKEYNIRTGKTRKITRRTRYISPSWSPAGDYIAALNTDPDYSFSMVILNSRNGNLLFNVPSPENKYLQYPTWIKTTGKIAVIATGEEGKSIYEYDLIDGTWTEILKAGFFNIDELTSEGDFLYFSGGFSGIDEIYSYSLLDKKIRKQTNAEFGAFNPDVNGQGNAIAYSSYGINGHDIIVKQIDPLAQLEFRPSDFTAEQSFLSVDIKPDSAVKQGVLTENKAYQEKTYHKIGNLFNFHSWAPYWFDYMEPNVHDPVINPGVTLLSQNELSTAVASLGYERKEGINYFHSRFTYKGLYPVFDFSSNYGGDPIVASVEDVARPETKTNFYYNASVYFPLTLSSGRYLSGIQPSLQYTYNSSYYYHFSEEVYKRGMQFIEPRFYLYSYRRLSQRNIQPRLGFTFDGRYNSTPFESGLYGYLAAAKFNLYLPGLFRNQGLRLRFEWQDQKVESYYFQNRVSLPRGYDPRIFININKYSADYAFPVLYPDLALGPLVYIKRFRGNLFVDYMKGIEKFELINGGVVKSKPEYPFSQGLELYADYHLFRFIVEFTSGIRFVYLPNEKESGLQFLFTVNLANFN